MQTAVLANARHELYCAHRAKGMVPKKAAIAAGFAQGSSIYSTLEDDPEIIARIADLTTSFQERREQQRAAALASAEMVGQVTGISKGWVIQQLVQVAAAARDAGDYKEANTALKLIGDEFHMFKGASAADDKDGDIPQHLDLDKTEALLDIPDRAFLDGVAAERPPVDMAMVERLIAGNKQVRIADRILTTGSETDVAFMPDAEPDDESEEPSS